MMGSYCCCSGFCNREARQQQHGQAFAGQLQVSRHDKTSRPHLPSGHAPGSLGLSMEQTQHSSSLLPAHNAQARLLQGIVLPDLLHQSCCLCLLSQASGRCHRCPRYLKAAGANRPPSVHPSSALLLLLMMICCQGSNRQQDDSRRRGGMIKLLPSAPVVGKSGLEVLHSVTGSNFSNELSGAQRCAILFCSSPSAPTLIPPNAFTHIHPHTHTLPPCPPHTTTAELPRQKLSADTCQPSTSFTRVPKADVLMLSSSTSI